MGPNESVALTNRPPLRWPQNFGAALATPPSRFEQLTN